MDSWRRERRCRPDFFLSLVLLMVDEDENRVGGDCRRD
ncbi:unnamed protein product, partial [Linum tenue]